MEISVNLFIQTIRNFFVAIWLTLRQINNGVLKAFEQLSALLFDFLRKSISFLANFYSSLRNFTILGFVRGARFLASIWPLYIFGIVLIGIGFLVKRFFAPWAIWVEVGVVVIVVIFAIANQIKNQITDEDKVKISDWDSVAHFAWTKMLFDITLALSVGVSSFYLGNFVPLAPHIQAFKRMLASTSSAAGPTSPTPARHVKPASPSSSGGSNNSGPQKGLTNNNKNVTQPTASAVLPIQVSPSSPQKLCAGGSFEVCLRNSNNALTRTVFADVSKENLEVLRQFCDNGDANSCYDLSIRIIMGEEGGNYRERGLIFYKKACGLGQSIACIELQRHEKVTDDNVGDLLSASTHKRACDAGNQWGCYMLAEDVSFGFGVPGSPRRAVLLYNTACDKGIELACWRVGRKPYSSQYLPIR
jgi:uncharacterized protein